MGLELAQATGLIGSSVLWQGQMVTLVGVNGTDGYLDTGVSSQVVPLSELSLAEASSRTIHRGTFSTPGVFRPQHAAVCSSEAPEVDPSLNACFDPTNPDNLDEILRQAGSSDPTQRAEGRAALREAARRARAEGHEEEFNRRVQQTLNEIGQEDLCASLNAQQAYTEVQSTLPPPPSANASNGNANGNPRSGTVGGVTPGGNGSPVVVADGGVAMPLGFGRGEGLATDGVMPVAFVGDGSVVVSSDGNVLLGTKSSPANGNADLPADDGSTSGALPVVVSAASLPVLLTPFTVDLPALSSAAIGNLDAPRFADLNREAAFFQNLFGPQTTANPSSLLVSLLTNPTPEFAPKLYDVRRAVADVVRTYQATYGMPNPAGPSRLTLNFRYDPERRRIAVSIDPMGRGRTTVARPTDADPSENPFDRFRGPFRSMSLFRIGSDDHIRGEDFGPIVAFVPVPMQYFQNIRLNNGTFVLRPSTHATDRGINRLASNDRGGSHSGERERRDPRDGRGDRDRRDQPEDPYVFLEENPDSVAA